MQRSIDRTRPRASGTARRAVVPLACLGLAAVLAGCSDEPAAEDPGTADGPTTEPEPTTPAAPTSPPADAYWCQILDPEEVERALADRLDDAVEVIVQDTAEGYECVVQARADGEDPLDALRYEIVIDAAEEFEQAKTDYVDESGAPLEGVNVGPRWLGEAYLSDAQAVAMAPCAAPGVPAGSDDQVPYMLRLTSPHEDAGINRADYVNILTRGMISLDRAIGCSPSEVAPTDAPTEAPEG